MLKKCTKCEHKFPATPVFFGVCNRSQSGLAARCRWCIRDSQQEQYQRNPKKFIKRANAWAKAHRKQANEYARDWVAKNRDQHALAVQRWTENNRDKRRAIGRAYAKRNPLTVRVKNQNRRARLRDAPGKFTKADARKQYEQQGGRCYWCKLPLEAYHLDHKIPLAKGGTNHPDNIVCACPSCNLSKGDLLPEDFIKKGQNRAHVRVQVLQPT